MNPPSNPPPPGSSAAEAARRILEQAQAQAQAGRPADIVREEATADALRREPGLFKPRNETPNVFVQAAKAPGEVAQMVIFVLVYLAAMIALVVFGGETARKLPGIFQCIILGVLVIPVMWITSRIWEAIGERGRDVARFFVRAWPLTLILLIVVLGGLKLLFATR